MLECWEDLWHKELVECFCGSCCPEVQLLLKAQTGFDASFLVGWMGNVGCEKEPSILHGTAWPSTHALHQNNQRLPVNQVGNGKSDRECGWFLNSKEHRWESGKECKTAAGRKCCSFCSKRGFSLLPNSTSTGNPIQHTAGIRKNLEKHFKKKED